MCRTKYLCFLDESGQPSFSENSSCWFFLTAIVFQKKRTGKYKEFLNQCIDYLYKSKNLKEPQNGIHWRDLNHDRKIALSKKYTELDFCQINICFWKEKFDRPEMIKKDNQYLYRYAARLAIERISWFVDDNHGLVDITFSDRTNFSKTDLRSYVCSIMQKDDCQIRSVFNPNAIEIKTFFDEPFLQIADHCASSIGESFNPDIYGNVHPFYVEYFIDKLYKYKNRKLWGYGIKVMPHDKVKKTDFIDTYKFTEQWFK